MSDPPSKRQKLKTTTACEPCRSRKIRCDGSKPSCEACLKRSQQCIYHATSDTKTANAYVDSLVNRVFQLEQELNHAHNTILRLSTAPPPTLPTLPTSPPIPPPIPLSNIDPALPPSNIDPRLPPSNIDPALPPSNIDPRLLPDYAVPSSDQGPVDAMGGDAGLQDHPDDGHTFYGSSSAHGFTRQMYGTVLQNHDSTTPDIPIDPALTQPSHVSSKPSTPYVAPDTFDPALTQPSHASSKPSIPYVAPDTFSLLPRELADHLMHLYWHRVHVLYPFLHRPSFSRTYQDLWKPKSQRRLHYDPASGLGLGAAAGPSSVIFHCAFNAALALGMQFSDLPLSEKERLSSACLAKSKELLKLDLFDDGNIALVQTLLLLTQYFQSTNWPSKCWTSIGLACRLAQGLGLHIETTHPAHHPNPDEDEMRTRVWHGCVTLDIIVSMTLGRPAMLLGSKARSLPKPLDSGEENLPISTDSNTSPSSIDFFTETVKLYRIIGRILLNIYRADDVPFDDPRAAEDQTTLELNDDLTKFAENLPRTLQWRQSTGDRQATDLLERQSHVLHVRFLHARILLFRPSFLSFCRSNKFKDGSTGKSTATLPEPLQTALELIDAIKEYSATEATGAWWYNVFYTRAAAMVVLLAGVCAPIFDLLGEEAWQRAWTNCVDILTKNLPQYAPVKACLKTLTALRRNVLRQRLEAAPKERHESPPNLAVELHTNANGDDFDPFEFVESDFFTDFGFDFTQPLV